MDWVRKVRENWVFVVSAVGALSWLTSQAIIATTAITTAQAEIKSNRDSIEVISSSMDAHVESPSGHNRITERLIKLESDVSHIDSTQSDNFKDIKDQLKIIQEDVKRLGSR